MLKLLKDTGYEIQFGKNIGLRRTGQKQNIRLRSLGEGYSEQELRAVLSGSKVHVPRKKKVTNAPQKTSLLIDINAKIAEGKRGGYERFAKVFNLKQMAKTVLYLQQNNLTDLAQLSAKATATTERFNELSTQIKTAEQRMGEIAVLKTHIANYAKTRSVFDAYKVSGYSKKYLAEHESDILIHRAAKKAFNDMQLKTLPTVKSLQAEYANLIAEKKAAYAEYRSVRDEMKELQIHKSNIEQILNYDTQAEEKEKEHDR